MPPYQENALQTRTSLAADLAAIGLAPGMTIIVHSALSRIGWVLGGAGTVIEALTDVIGGGGTVVMPTFSGWLSDPSTWIDPSVPLAWHEAIRASMPTFDPARTTTRNMGRIPELFRTWPGVYRSWHPVMSLAAWGRDAAALVAQHSLAWALGDDTPMGQIYRRDGSILLVGVGHERNSSLHLAETRAKQRRTRFRTMPIERDGALTWETYPDVANDSGVLFPRVGAAFEAEGRVSVGRVGLAESRLMRHRDLVDFATGWFDRQPGAN